MADKNFLDWPFLEDRHGKLAKGLDDWARSNLGAIDHKDVDAACRGLVATLGHDGWLDWTAVDPSDPSSKLDVRGLCIMRETLARHDGLADFVFAMQGLGTGAISLFGTAVQKRAWLAKTRAGKAISAFALSEPKSGSDVASLDLAATRDGDFYVLDGEKTWISNGGIADFYVTFARSELGISAFLVKAEEVDAAERIDIIAPHPMATVKFQGSRAELLGEAGQGFKLAMRNLDIFRTTVAGAALG
ncbi:MAG: acyl-CoA dehydrogenase family protein, partial [Dongiaceae bacterium]